ncbi:hypothetical protein L9W73_17265 [Vibrio aestuarianus]|uniref:Uncharacterized protein n=1 Tax=Vibrio aestuarianus TaxID=28171 RepID=A0A9X4J1X9_9VIBR|nr:hypothetical protein [Vibrio aestuarianus]MDE1311827.1 hypothetical protein [Vibrio aestuarianus]MDE1312591.1 hypothetical protein [Vibrio aestuarianus]MDE1359027.1 hypothetical protein [Vibrio aestuarianus]NGZ94041.1 hypothetical protein [Vibrio aestuarianus subsp. cardii]
MNEILSYFQIGANAFALTVAGWIYLAYIKNLNSTVKLKDEQVKTVEKNIQFWKDKVSELERRSPEHVEKLLSERIKIREDEIVRLSEDKNIHKHEIDLKNQELLRLKSEVEKTKDLKRTFDALDFFIEEDDELFSKDAEYEIEELGFVAVDSGQLMITDPCYIDSQWQDDDLEILRLYKDVENSNVIQYGKDFNHYDDVINGYDQSANQLLASGRIEALEVDYTDRITFSYAGASYATLSNKGYGSMPFELGHEGAGIVVRTVLGDGMYPVYAEKYDGKMVRVYFNLL